MAYGCPLYDTELELAVDHDTAIVTSEMWEAERAKLSKPKANAQGWMRTTLRQRPTPTTNAGPCYTARTVPLNIAHVWRGN